MPLDIISITVVYAAFFKEPLHASNRNTNSATGCVGWRKALALMSIPLNDLAYHAAYADVC